MPLVLFVKFESNLNHDPRVKFESLNSVENTVEVFVYKYPSA